MIERLLIANRGEIALRIQRSAAEMGIACVVVASEDDAGSLHVLRAEACATLPGRGPVAYLDQAAIIAAARAHDCDAIHPGYGFLSENAEFAVACNDGGIIFAGPSARHLAMLGDKAAARELATQCGVQVPAGTRAGIELDDARAFMDALGKSVMVKALAGGGGRGIRRVEALADLDAAYERCRSEAKRTFGDDRVYLEQAISGARHIEVQVIGDGQGGVVHLGERDCTVQRRNQKLIEIAPAPTLDAVTRAALCQAAVAMARAIDYANAGTFEFLVAGEEFWFLEANPRLQVEHTVTEELWGVDLVRAQLQIAAGATIGETGLDRARQRPGFAVQARINAERLDADGTPAIDGRPIAAYEPASGPGVRVDGAGYRGYAANTAFDSLVAKLIVSTREGTFAHALAKLDRALGEFTVAGVATTIPLLRALVRHLALASDALNTRFVDDNLAELLAAAEAFEGTVEATPQSGETFAEGLEPVRAPLTGVVIDLLVEPGAPVAAGQPLAVVEAMKMEHVLEAPCFGTVAEVRTAKGDAIQLDQLLLLLEPGEVDVQDAHKGEVFDPCAVRPNLQEVLDRQARALDPARGEAIAKRHAKGQRSARENVAALVDPGSFVEYGSLAVAAQRARRSADELAARTPADGCVVGFGTINGEHFAAEHAQSLVIAFDETVLAGTVGEMAREKMKHALESARQARRPVVLLAEGGGGRAGDTDGKVGVTGWTMDVSTYHQLGRMSGLAPLVGVTSGRCFAANAGMLACCDVIIATEGANIGVGGPSMIEGGRLGSFAPEEIGPMEVQTQNGVVDVLVADEAAAVEMAKRYLAYFQGPVADWTCADQREARSLVPENRLRAYDMRRVIALIADSDSVLELRPGFGRDILTALVRVEGRPIGVIANNPMQSGGAIEADGADKACRFMKLCEGYGLPLLFLCDTPGMMVGPEAEKTATVRKMGRMFVTGANLTVPTFTVVTRKAYGIGAELMAGGWFKAPRFVVSWPTGEFGGMNIEGNVNLAHAAELTAIVDPVARRARFDELVATMYETGRALSVATHFEIDDVIDPADTRRWIASGMVGHQQRPIGSEKRAPFVDPW